MRGYASQVRPLTALLCKNTEYDWSAECAAAFAAVKEQLTSAPLLAIPDLNEPFTVISEVLRFLLGSLPAARRQAGGLRKQETKPR